jgi:hypothetical protein
MCNGVGSQVFDWEGRHGGRTTSDNRVFANGVLWVLRSGAHWHDLPERYCKYKNVHPAGGPTARSRSHDPGCHFRIGNAWVHMWGFHVIAPRVMVDTRLVVHDFNIR